MSTHSKHHKKKVPNSVWKKKQNIRKSSRKFAESDKRDASFYDHRVFHLKPWKVR